MGGRVPRVVTTDEHASHDQAIPDAFGVDVTPRRTGKPGRPCKARREPHPGLTYATVCETLAKGRVMSVVMTLVLGTVAMLAAALRPSSCGRRVNTSFIERVNGTARHGGGPNRPFAVTGGMACAAGHQPCSLTGAPPAD